MINKRFKQMMILALTTLGTTVVSTPAKATLMVDIGGTVSGGVYTPGMVFFDNQPGVDANPAIGILDIGAFLNGIAFNFHVNGFGTTSGSPIASISSNANANLLPSVVLPLGVNIVISDNGFSNPPTPLFLNETINLLSSLNGLTATGTADGFYGASNTDFDVSGPSTGTASSILTGGIATNIPATSGSISGATPYSLTEFIHLDITARGSDPVQNIQVNTNLSASGSVPPPIPEPSTAVLMGTGILGLTMLFRKKYRRS